MSDYKKPAHWSNPKNKLFPYQVGFTCPPHDFDGAPSDFLRIAPETVGVHGRMLHVPDYKHQLSQRKQNFSRKLELSHKYKNVNVLEKENADVIF